MEKLEVLVLLESDDEETIAAARAARPPATVRLVVVPDAPPKTKPKACNVGLLLATGEHLVIYDAEDRPEPAQLRKAVAAFRAAGEETVCVQARLQYWNFSTNLLTRMFGLEYGYWFGAMLPGLDRLRLPIPLGGTSNHFRTDALRRLGGCTARRRPRRPSDICGSWSGWTRGSSVLSRKFAGSLRAPARA